MVVSAVVRATSILGAGPAQVLLPAETNPEERGDWEQPVGHLDDHTKTLEFAGAIARAAFDPRPLGQRDTAR
jgi:hypothetical protein